MAKVVAPMFLQHTLLKKQTGIGERQWTFYLHVRKDNHIELCEIKFSLDLVNSPDWSGNKIKIYFTVHVKDFSLVLRCSEWKISSYNWEIFREAMGRGGGEGAVCLKVIF